MTTFNLFNASQEFNVSRETLRKKLMALELPGPEYTIAQICKAIYGDMYGERLRKLTEEADALARKRAEDEKRLVNVAEFGKQLVAKAVKVKGVIADLIPDPDLQFKVLNALADLFQPETMPAPDAPAIQPASEPSA